MNGVCQLLLFHNYFCLTRASKNSPLPLQVGDELQKKENRTFVL